MGSPAASARIRASRARNYSFRDVARWSVLHLAELVFAVGFIPACALIVLAGMAWAAPRTIETRERVFLALAVASTFWMVLSRGRVRIALRRADRGAEHVLPRAAAPTGARDLARQGPATPAAAGGCRGRRARSAPPLTSARKPLQRPGARRHAWTHSVVEGCGPPRGWDQRSEGPPRTGRPRSGPVLHPRAEALGGRARSTRHRPFPDRSPQSRC